METLQMESGRFQLPGSDNDRCQISRGAAKRIRAYKIPLLFKVDTMCMCTIALQMNPTCSGVKFCPQYE